MALIPGILYLLLLLIFPKESSESSFYALTLWASSVVPSLLPNFCASMLLIHSGAVNILGKLFDKPANILMRCPGYAMATAILSYTCGFPTGAAMIGELYKSGALNRDEARTTCSFASSCSPGFILGAAASFSGTQGYTMLISHIAGAIICGFLFKKCDTDAADHSHTYPALPFAQALSLSLSKGGTAMVGIGASMVFFTVLANTAFLNIPAASFILEMTIGAKLIGELILSTRIRSALICACVSFGGLCIFMQSEPHIHEFISPWQYLFQKMIHALISGIICFVIFTAG